MDAHHEKHLEAYIVQKLVENGWVEGHNSHYDPSRALYSEDVVIWIKKTQAEAWDKLTRLHGASAEVRALERLKKALELIES
ncbi:MAG: restriction endonuclease [Gammaproteobacteria bacterium]|jgi:type I restriction enzyme R subunit|nr:restriction endonuclease [Gammaproteobacteria bacterium]